MLLLIGLEVFHFYVTFLIAKRFFKEKPQAGNTKKAKREKAKKKAEPKAEEKTQDQGQEEKKDADGDKAKVFVFR